MSQKKRMRNAHLKDVEKGRKKKEGFRGAKEKETKKISHKEI